MKKGDCGCRNHLGKPKVKFASQEAAVHAILTRHLRFGPHYSYACENMDGVWHIASVATKNSSGRSARRRKKG